MPRRRDLGIVGAHLLNQHIWTKSKYKHNTGKWLLPHSCEPISLAIIDFKMFRYRKARKAGLQMGWTFHICTFGKPYPSLASARTRGDTKPLPKWKSLQLFIFTDISISTFEFCSRIYLELTWYWCVRATSSAPYPIVEELKKEPILAKENVRCWWRRAGAEEYMGRNPHIKKNETAPLCPPLSLVGWWGCQKNEVYLGINPHIIRPIIDIQ